MAELDLQDFVHKMDVLVKFLKSYRDWRIQTDVDKYAALVG